MLGRTQELSNAQGSETSPRVPESMLQPGPKAVFVWILNPYQVSFAFPPVDRAQTQSLAPLHLQPQTQLSFFHPPLVSFPSSPSSPLLSLSMFSSPLLPSSLLLSLPSFPCPLLSSPSLSSLSLPLPSPSPLFSFDFLL